jgi:hypothetical protein
VLLLVVFLSNQNGAILLPVAVLGPGLGWAIREEPVPWQHTAPKMLTHVDIIQPFEPYIYSDSVMNIVS